MKLYVPCLMLSLVGKRGQLESYPYYHGHDVRGSNADVHTINHHTPDLSFY